MAKFDESKVINALHTEKAEVGKKYWFAHNIVRLKELVEKDRRDLVHILRDTPSDRGDLVQPFGTMSNTFFSLIYPYEEPPKKRMTNIQLMEWVSKGNGIINYYNGSTYYYTDFVFMEQVINNEVSSDIRIRSWDSEEWIEPTVDIYERDCKVEN